MTWSSVLPGTTAMTASPSRTRVPSTDASRPTRLIQPSRVSTTLVFSLDDVRLLVELGRVLARAHARAPAVAVLLAQRVQLVLDDAPQLLARCQDRLDLLGLAFFSCSSSRIFLISIWAMR